jgi:hypothetical protein
MSDIDEILERAILRGGTFDGYETYVDPEQHHLDVGPERRGGKMSRYERVNIRSHDGAAMFEFVQDYQPDHMSNRAPGV